MNWKTVTQAEQTKRKKKCKRNEDNLRDLWDNVKHTNICTIPVKKEKREINEQRLI